VINTNLPPILYRFLPGPKSIYLAAFNPPPMEGFPCDDLRKIFRGCQPSTDGQGTKWRRNIADNFNRLIRVHERYRQTTDGRATDSIIIANVNVSLLKRYRNPCSCEDILVDRQTDTQTDTHTDVLITILCLSQEK